MSVPCFQSKPQGTVGKQKGNVATVPCFITSFLAPMRFFFSHAILRGTVTSNEPNVDTPMIDEWICCVGRMIIIDK